MNHVHLRSILLILCGAAGGALLTLAAVAFFGTDAFRGGPAMGPIGIVPAGATKRGYLGVTFSNEPSRSLYVAEVSPAVPADSSHLHVGDRVTSLGGRQVLDFRQVELLLSNSKPGDVLELGIVRNEQAITLKVQLLSMGEAIAARPGSAK